MQSRTTRQFWRLFRDLPADAQRDAKRAYRLFRANAAHPGLHFKKLEGEEDIYSAWIGLDYRALTVIKNDRVVWYWIATMPTMIGWSDRLTRERESFSAHEAPHSRGSQFRHVKPLPVFFGMPEIVLKLLIEPALSARVEGEGEPDRHLWADAGPSIKNAG